MLTNDRREFRFDRRRGDRRRRRNIAKTVERTDGETRQCVALVLPMQFRRLRTEIDPLAEIVFQDVGKGDEMIGSDAHFALHIVIQDRNVQRRNQRVVRPFPRRTNVKRHVDIDRFLRRTATDGIR